MNLDRYVDTSRGKGLLGARMGIVGGALLMVALAGWLARDFLPTLAMTAPGDSTRLVPNELSERIALGIRVIVVLLMLAAQLLMVVGAHFTGTGRRGLVMTIVMPFVLILVSASSNGTSRRGTAIFESTDFGFLLVMLAVTPISVVVSLWLTRDPGRRRSRAKRH